MVSAELVAAVDGLDPVAFEGEAFRHVAINRHPLSRSGARSQGGRWNPPESFATLYLGLDRDTVVNEFLRLVRRSNRAPQDFLPRRSYRYELKLGALIDLRDAPAQGAVGLSQQALRGVDLTHTQAVGEAAHYLGREGVIAPSAAGPGSIVAVFFDRLEADSYVHDLDFETWEAPPGSPSP